MRGHTWSRDVKGVKRLRDRREGRKYPCVVHEFAAEKTMLYDAVIFNAKRKKKRRRRVRSRTSEEPPRGTVRVRVRVAHRDSNR